MDGLDKLLFRIGSELPKQPSLSVEPITGVNALPSGLSVPVYACNPPLLLSSMGNRISGSQLIKLSLHVCDYRDRSTHTNLQFITSLASQT